MMKRIYNRITIALLVLGVLGSLPLSSLGASKVIVSGKVTYTIDLSRHGPDKEASVWIPYPVSGPYQDITNIEVKGTYSYWGVYTDKVFGDPMLYAYWAKGVRKRKLEFSFDVKRIERIDVPKGPFSQECVDHSLLGRYLAPSGLVVINARVKRLAASITKGKHTSLDKAKAIYDWVTENMRRDPSTKGCGKGDVCFTLFKSRSGKCADISSVYVALLRAAGVPAREVFGIRLGRAASQNITHSQHCWSEFYVPGYGWVASDPADYAKAVLKQQLSHNDPRAKKTRKYFFTAVDPYRVRLSLGREIQLNPVQSGPRLNFFMYPYGEIGGRPLDALSPDTFFYKIEFVRKGGNSIDTP